MLKSLTLTALVLAVVPATAQTYATGYAIGAPVMSSATNGGMLLGNDASVLVENKPIMVGRGVRSSVKVMVNSFSFALRESDTNTSYTMNAVSQGQGKVLVHFTQPFLGGLVYHQANLVDGAVAVEPELSADKCSSRSKLPSRSKGEISGRLVKLSLEGYASPLFSKVWEATVQVGNSGDKFAHMIVSDAGMAACLVQYMHGNRLAKISFNEVKHPTSLELVNDMAVVQAADGSSKELSLALPTPTPIPTPTNSSGPLPWR